MTSGYHSPPQALASWASRPTPMQTPNAIDQIVYFRKLMTCTPCLRRRLKKLPNPTSTDNWQGHRFQQQVACHQKKAAIAGLWAQVRVPHPTPRVAPTTLFPLSPEHL